MFDQLNSSVYLNEWVQGTTPETPETMGFPIKYMFGLVPLHQLYQSIGSQIRLRMGRPEWALLSAWTEDCRDARPGSPCTHQLLVTRELGRTALETVSGWYIGKCLVIYADLCPPESPELVF